MKASTTIHGQIYIWIYNIALGIIHYFQHFHKSTESELEGVKSHVHFLKKC